MDLIFQCLILSLASAIALLYLLTRARASTSGNGQLPPPPGPWPLPIVGNLFLLGNEPHRALARLSKTHGPLMSLQLGRTTTIVVSSPDVARDILQKHDSAFSSRTVPDAIRALRHDETSIAWLPAAAPWRNLRRICSTQLFTPQRVSSGKEVRSQKVRELVARVRERCSAGEAVDVGREAFDTIVDLITNTFFSVDEGGLVSGTSGRRSFRELVSAIMEEVGAPNVSDFFPAIAAVDLQGRRRRTAEYFGTLHEFFDEMMERRMKEDGRSDFLNYLMRGDGDRKLDHHAIKSLLTDLFGAGTDTSSNTVEWAMAELLRNPRLMTKAQEELAQTIGMKEMDEDDIARLPYLQAIVKETLRLHPPVPFLLPRRAEMSIELGGYIIQKGARVLVNVWAMGQDPNIWEDPNVFMPDRFISREIDYKGQNFELIPFGAGRRICPGLPLAFQMVHLVLASFLHSFNWKHPDGMDVDMTERFGVTLAKAIPLRAIPILNMC